MSIHIQTKLKIILSEYVIIFAFKVLSQFDISYCLLYNKSRSLY